MTQTRVDETCCCGAKLSVVSIAPSRLVEDWRDRHAGCVSKLAPKGPIRLAMPVAWSNIPTPEAATPDDV